MSNPPALDVGSWAMTCCRCSASCRKRAASASAASARAFCSHSLTLEGNCKCLQRMAPQVGLEPTTLRLTVGFHPICHTTETNQAQCTQSKQAALFGYSCTCLAAVHGHNADTLAPASELASRVLNRRSVAAVLSNNNVYQRRKVIANVHLMCTRAIRGHEATD